MGAGRQTSDKQVTRNGRAEMKSGFAAAALAASLVARATPTTAQEDLAAFYRGKTLRIVVGVSVGSGYDLNARLLARYMAPHIPGNPTIIVQNQPGAGSLTMTNQLYAAGPFDGTEIGASFNGKPTTPLLQPGGRRCEPAARNRLSPRTLATHG